MYSIAIPMGTIEKVAMVLKNRSIASFFFPSRYIITGWYMNMYAMIAADSVNRDMIIIGIKK